MTVRGGMTVCGDMTVRGGMTISSSSRYLLAGSMLRDTANESRYDDE
ncbi:MAG: hypothetical protein KTM48_05065 [Wolbachia endosymbiont of Pissodes strobi]|nr:hypothetical protein [Wolbachia endosymbiont of Pissodes strobi]